jgi:hypothetical protein
MLRVDPWLGWNFAEFSGGLSPKQSRKSVAVEILSEQERLVAFILSDELFGACGDRVAGTIDPDRVLMIAKRVLSALRSESPREASDKILAELYAVSPDVALSLQNRLRTTSIINGIKPFYLIATPLDIFVGQRDDSLENGECRCHLALPTDR